MQRCAVPAAAAAAAEAVVSRHLVAKQRAPLKQRPPAPRDSYVESDRIARRPVGRRAN